MEKKEFTDLYNDTFLSQKQNQTKRKYKSKQPPQIKPHKQTNNQTNKPKPQTPNKFTEYV